MEQLDSLFLVLGIAVVLCSYLHYWRRTGDARGVLLFWRRAMAMSVLEFKLQRAGLLLMLVAVEMRFIGALG